MLIADTNLLVQLVGDGEDADRAREVYRRDPYWAAPRLWRSEFRNAMSLYVRQEIFPMPVAVERWRNAQRVVSRREFDVDGERVLSLAAASGCSAYDCEFVHLAQRLDVPLVTFDRRLRTAFPLVSLSPHQFLAS